MAKNKKPTVAKKRQLDVTGVDEDQIVSRSDYMAYKGSIFEQIVRLVLSRSAFIMLTIFVYTTVALMFYMTLAFGALIVIIGFEMLRFKSIKRKSNSRFIARASPLIKKIAPKKWSELTGDMLVGFEEGTNRQLWKSSSDFLYHSYVIGSSGSGKSVFLISVFMVNYLAIASGILFLDFKGTVELMGQALSTAYRVGRATCFKALNYTNPQPKGSVLKNSNNVAPAVGNDEYASYKFFSPFFTTEGGASGDSKYFEENSIKLFQTLLTCLHYLQKHNYLRITPSVIRKYAGQKAFLDLYWDPRLPNYIKEEVLAPTYIAFKLEYETKNAKQIEDNERMFGLYSNGFDSALKFFIDNYPQIFESLVPEFDVINIVNNRQIGFLILPTADKDETDTRKLATIGINLVRGAIASGLGNDFHGGKDDVMAVARTADDSPFCIVIDEAFVGMESSNGVGLLFSQGRGCGLAGVLSSQDVSALDESNRKENRQAQGSSKNKFLLCLKDTLDSLQYVESCIPTIDELEKAPAEESHTNRFDNRKVRVERNVKAYKPELIADDALFDKGEMLAIGAMPHKTLGGMHCSKVRCFFYDQTKFIIENLRLTNQLPTIPSNELVIKENLNLIKLSDGLSTAVESAKAQFIKNVKSKPESNALFFSMSGSGWGFYRDDELINKNDSDSEIHGFNEEAQDEVLNFMNEVFPESAMHRFTKGVSDTVASNMDFFETDSQSESSLGELGEETPSSQDNPVDSPSGDAGDSYVTETRYDDSPHTTHNNHEQASELAHNFATSEAAQETSSPVSADDNTGGSFNKKMLADLTSNSSETVAKFKMRPDLYADREVIAGKKAYEDLALELNVDSSSTSMMSVIDHQFDGFINELSLNSNDVESVISQAIS